MRIGQPITWALITAIASFLPVAGTVFVWLPIGMWLIVDGRIGAGAFLLAYGFLVVVGFVD